MKFNFEIIILFVSHCLKFSLKRKANNIVAIV